LDPLKLTLLEIAVPEETVRAARISRLLTFWQLLRPQLVFWLESMHRPPAALNGMTQSVTAKSHHQLLRVLRSDDSDLCEQFARRHTKERKKMFDGMDIASGETRILND
jgi:DNA-binding GntR family transcriptional regulator